ncbi:MAG: cytochrome b/b6 domain-containing protein [Methyloprofundus sp.]|nr:cytochrome b/b6 domain-containing protein [Methyloprofundus sp.]MBW6453104.1 cytochrome b/b6 domain-containing protein [Methyloprofundus sp.]
MQNKVLVWDLTLRIFHCLLVAAFFVAYISEDDWLTVHVWAGYLVAGLLVFRVIWGFIGSQYARFASFICPVSQSKAYLMALVEHKAKRYLGHNPAGSLMIVLLLISLLLIVLSGLALYAADQNAGPLAGMISSTYEHFWKEVHEIVVNFTVVLIGIHIAGVIVESWVHGENLVRSMCHGYKNSEQQD